MIITTAGATALRRAHDDTEAAHRGPYGSDGALLRHYREAPAATPREQFERERIGRWTEWPEDTPPRDRTDHHRPEPEIGSTRHTDHLRPQDTL